MVLCAHVNCNFNFLIFYQIIECAEPEEQKWVGLVILVQCMPHPPCAGYSTSTGAVMLSCSLAGVGMPELTIA